MRTSSTTLLAWIISQVSWNRKDDANDTISLETLNNNIRLVVWLILLLHMSAMTFFSPTRLPIYVYIFCYTVWFGYLYLLRNSRNELLKGLPFLVLNLGATLALVLKGESYYLRLTTISLPSLPVYSIQGFPPGLVLALGTGYFCIHKYFLHYLDIFYEPITSSYRIPAVSLENTLKGYRVGLVLEVVCLMTYQIVVQRLWRNYQNVRRNLQETNQKLQLANIQLAKNVEELDNLNKQLKSALQSQDLFVACVSHELRNPLNVMLGSLDLMEPHVKDTNQMQLLKTCRVCGDTLLSQINNLLDVAKINADKLEISEYATNMGVFLEKFWSFTRIGLEKKGLQGYLAVDKRMSLWLNIDEQRLQQILNNLVGNAIKFTSEGSVRISLRWIKGGKLSSWSSNNLRGRSETMNTDQTIQVDQNYEAKRNFRTSPRSPQSPDLSTMNEGVKQETYSSEAFPCRNDPNDFLSFKLHQSVKGTLESLLPCSDETEDNFLKLDVIDTGCGISEEAQESVFEPFVQGDRSITRKYGGTGLGLYIVKSLVSKMGGHIKIASLRGVGTHFQIILPVKATKRIHAPRNVTSIILPCSEGIYSTNRRLKLKRRQSEELESPTREKPSKRVLVTDDDPFNRSLLKEYFKKFNIVCDVATNGAEGLQIYKENPARYSFVTMDIQMPVMDGITACQKIRKYEKENNRPRIPIAVITGNCSEDERKVCLDGTDIEASYFFRKPFRLSDCKLCVERLFTEP